MADSLPPETLAWLRQCAALDGAAYPQALLHLLERIELLDKDSIEQSQSNRFCFEAVIKRLEKLEAAQQHDTLLIGGPQDKLDRLIELDSDDDAPTPEPAPVATDEELCRVYDDGPTSFAPALRAIYNLGRQHGAAQRLEQETDR